MKIILGLISDDKLSNIIQTRTYKLGVIYCTSMKTNILGVVLILIYVAVIACILPMVYCWTDSSNFGNILTICHWTLSQHLPLLSYKFQQTLSQLCVSSLLVGVNAATSTTMFSMSTSKTTYSATLFCRTFKSVDTLRTIWGFRYGSLFFLNYQWYQASWAMYEFQ